MQTKNLTLVLEAGSHITEALRALKKVRGLIQSGVSGDVQISDPVKDIENLLQEARDKVITLAAKEQE